MIVILLHKTQMAENLGAVARAMGNFALSELRLIAPHCSPQDEQAIAMSAGADSILKGAKIYDCLEMAIADIHLLYGTCATVRHMIKQYTPISEIAPKIIFQTTNAPSPATVGILFGPERTGLDNDCLAKCHEIIQIPVNPDFSSLNLAQACVVIGYELYKAQQTQTSSTFHFGETRPAPQKQVESFLLYLEKELDEVDYWRVPSKKPIMWRNLQNILTRFHLTEQDIQTLWGMVTSLKKGKSK